MITTAPVPVMWGARPWTRGACAAPTAPGRPIRPGVARAEVRELLRGVPHDPAWRFGDDDNTLSREAYFFRNEARFFFLAPNPEGGLIGLLPRSVEYSLFVDYDAAGRVRHCTLLKTRDVTSPHPVWSMP